MKQQTIDKLIALNTHFYVNVEKEFSATRQILWRGYQSLFDYLNSTNNSILTVLDIACGNGRFVKTLEQNLNNKFSYLGLDNNKFLIDEASKSFKSESIRFKNFDIFNEDLSIIDEKFDLIVVFGLLHHIPSNELRIKFMKSLRGLLNINGRLVFTTWNFTQIKLFENRLNDDEINNLGIDLTELDENDYFLKWNNSNENIRYCHYYSDKEISNLLSHNDFKLDYKFLADGKDAKTNTYYIISRQE
jgi:SAM-dependent methyltransferase